MDKRKKVTVHMYKGSVYTVDVSKMDDEVLVGVDKFGYPIKLQMSEIKNVIPLSGTSARW